MAQAARKLQTKTTTDMTSGAILNALPDAVLLINGDLNIQSANLAAQSFFAASALEGLNLADIVSESSPLCMITQKTFKTGQSFSDRHFSLNIPRCGSHKKAALQIILIDEVNVLVILREEGLSDRLDREYKHRRAVRSFQMMASMLAHEIKNPLSGIKGAARLLASSVSSAEDKSLAVLIENEAGRIHRLTDKVGMFSDSAPPALSPVNLHTVLDHVRGIANAGFANHARIEIDYDPSLPEISGDRDQLTQVFLNLVKNAAEAVPATCGVITLKTFYNKGPHRGALNRARLSFGAEVRDNGRGIPENIKPHLFEPFHTTKAEGSGIGLSLAAKIIDDHDGAIEAESKPGLTRFTVFLPFSEREGK